MGAPQLPPKTERFLKIVAGLLTGICAGGVGLGVWALGVNFPSTPPVQRDVCDPPSRRNFRRQERRWGASEFSSYHDDQHNPLLQDLRAPSQTEAQSDRWRVIAGNAENQSRVAKTWLLIDLENNVRPHLDKTLQNLSSQLLLERLTWEWKRLPILHSIPVTANATAGILHDDSSLTTSLANGYLQNVCQRYVLGGMQPLSAIWNGGYIDLHFTERFGMHNFTEPNNMSLQEANDCLLYCTNNLLKRNPSNIRGGMQFVLNPSTVSEKVFFEAWDADLTEEWFDSGLANKHYPGFGTVDHFYHLIQPFETMMNSGKCEHHFNLAQLFNLWWVPEAPVPDSCQLRRAPYNQVMVLGNVLLPEDLLYGMAKYSDSNDSGEGPTLWGKPFGSQLQDFFREKQRPLVWFDDHNSGMIVDASVGSISGDRISREDEAWFECRWSKKPAVSNSFKEFLDEAPSHLRFHYPAWDRRNLCEDFDQDVRYMVMGTDDADNCVYWTVESSGTKSAWECHNDGTCSQSFAGCPRALFKSESDCLGSCGQGPWACVKRSPAFGSDNNAPHFCKPTILGQCADQQSCLDTCIGEAVLLS